MVAVVLVDGTLVSSAGAEALKEFVTNPCTCFAINGLSKAAYYMRCHTSRNRPKKKLRMDQHLYVQTLTDRFGVYKTSVVPAITGEVQLSKRNSPHTSDEEEEMRGLSYRETVRALMWASIMTRSDTWCHILR